MARPERSLYIGIDGGGSKTCCVVGDASGQVIHAGYGGATNVKSSSRAETEDVLLHLLEDTLARCGASMGNVRGLSLCLAGGHRPSDKAAMKQFMVPYFSPETRIDVQSDATAAWAAGTWGQPGIVLIAGTGSIAYGRLSPEGREERAGGWGYLLGDEGSGFELSRKALQAVLRHYDGRGPATVMTEAVLARLGLNQPEELIDWLYGHPAMRRELAALSDIVMDAAGNGDHVGETIVADAVGELTEQVRAVRKRLGDDNLPVITAGGLFSAPYFYSTFQSAWRQHVGKTGECRLLTLPPAVGAYYLALHGAGLASPTTGKTIENSLRE
ncbi:N-acetylglucosamine kinase-like BadF-type ATPase [Paenibacillus cellulosilyticus]|uniref:N-acetylglucosamine kinase-like BadF-type ATPase n=1 Tax=Paenibacillus cellulosilyticus TaxID=375489 RepID=A0A2V2YUB3_9BACL|nr:BadF/BadG/BcrA/BcrD ATPase family protein [Paenibacillus cellulosilyticus]PWW03178.1 N-acetylglucosamine kinase-like BadF-type ATPase [Paenibacillus cellulosilyticus]QKS43670.1 N-acetylglucosamine kinase [Paenibacillus cellulosilyticus]